MYQAFIYSYPQHAAIFLFIFLTSAKNFGQKQLTMSLSQKHIVNQLQILGH